MNPISKHSDVDDVFRDTLAVEPCHFSNDRASNTPVSRLVELLYEPCNFDAEPAGHAHDFLVPEPALGDFAANKYVVRDGDKTPADDGDPGSVDEQISVVVN